MNILGIAEKSSFLTEWINKTTELLQSLPYFKSILIGIAILFAAWFVYRISRAVLEKIASMAVKRTNTNWDDNLLELGFFRRLSVAIPFILIYFSASLIDQQDWQIWVEKISKALIFISLIRSASLLLEAALSSYNEKKTGGKSISGVIQIAKLILYAIGLILVLTMLLDESPWGILSGLGAMTAILTLVFKDTILSLVASVQFSLNKTMKVGDWIEVPEYGADGDVVDITLHSVKIQNWDKTYVTIPTHRFLEQGFKNWKGMSESGGRRIKRNLYLDQTSVRFLDNDEIQKLQNIEILKPYLIKRKREVDNWNSEHEIDNSEYINGRTLTNIGTFRAYTEAFLRNHKKIHKSGMTLMVRQLQPTEKGIGLQLYCFTTTTDWVEYETIQADIFDHLIASLSSFDLRLFQSPTGQDFNTLAANGK